MIKLSSKLLKSPQSLQYCHQVWSTHLVKILKCRKLYSMAIILGDSSVLVLANAMANSFYFARLPFQIHLYPYAIVPSFSILVAIIIVATNGGDGWALRLVGHSHPIFPPIKGYFIQNQCFDIVNIFCFTLRDANL